MERQKDGWKDGWKDRQTDPILQEPSGYPWGSKNRTLSIFLPEARAYGKDFDETKYVSFSMKVYKLLEKYNKIWEKVRNSIKNEFDSEPIYNVKYIETRITSYNGKIKTNFNNNKIPKEGSQCICLSVILIDSVFRTGKNYYP